MEKLQFVCAKSDRILKVLNFLYPQISYNSFSSALRKKDILVNGIRVKDNIKVFEGDEIIVFVASTAKKQLYEIYYEDENIIIVNKKKGIEVCDGEINVQSELCKKYFNISAVHRIDQNTSGLVLFAKKQNVFDELCKQLKFGNIKKFYIAKVFGNPETSAVLQAYLVKDAKKSFVKIYNQQVLNAQKIITEYKLIKKDNFASLLEVELFSGKTHQIRAHLAHVGLPIVGDNKYGDNEKNKLLGKNKQCLTAYKLIFCLPARCWLNYLNDKIFELKDYDM